MVPDDRLGRIEDRLYRIETKLDKFIEIKFNDYVMDLAAEISDIEEEVRWAHVSLTELLTPWAQRVLGPPDDGSEDGSHRIVCADCDLTVDPVPGPIRETICPVCRTSESLELVNLRPRNFAQGWSQTWRNIRTPVRI